MDDLLKNSVPPHDIESEKAVLGTILMDWSCAGEVFIKLKPFEFYIKQHKIIFSIMLEMFTAGIQGDAITLSHFLKDKNQLEEIGGSSYIASLTDVVSTSSNINYYTEKVHNCYIRRELINISGDIRVTAFDEGKETRKVLDDAEKRIFAISDSNSTIQIHEMSNIVGQTFEQIHHNMASSGDYTGIPSGLVGLDTMTSGFQKSELIVIGARPSMGKTALALSFMEHIAVENKIPCGFFSLEMSHVMIGQRLLSQVGHIPGYKLKSGTLTTSDMKKLQDTAGKLFESPLYIVDQPNMQLIDLRAMARRMKANFNVQIIFIDYIGLIGVENTQAKVFEQVSEVSKSLKALARELDIPVVALCQVSREAEGEEPNLAQLRGSGSIEQDADVVMFIHRKRDKTEGDNPAIESKLIVAKQRNGAIGDVKMMFFPHFTKFENAAEDPNA